MTTTMPPTTKASLKLAMFKDTPLDEAGSTLRMQHNGRFNWLVQTCFPTLATAVSVAQGLPNVEGTLDLADHMYSWIKSHRLDGLISRSGNQEGFQFTCDADWAGLHSVTSEIKSRTGTLSTLKRMPVDWYSSLRKTIVSNWTDESVDIIATSTANSELIAAGAAQSRALHLSYIADELGIPVERPIRIFIDASAAKGFLENTGCGGRMKHLDIREGWIQQARDRSITEWRDIDGPDNPSDNMTKLNGRIIFDKQYAVLQYTPKAI